MKTARQIQEEIDDLAIEGQAIFDTAKGAGREMTADESKRFDEITEKLVPQLKTDLVDAEARETKMRTLAVQERRNKQADELSQIRHEGLERNAAAPVLPVNGNLPAAEGAGRVHLRTASLKAFKNETDAYNSGMWLRAMLNRDDRTAHEHCHRLGWAVSNAAGESTGAAGGYTVPTPLSQTIIDVREQVGVMRQLLQVMPMTADTLTVMKRTGGLTVYGGSENPTTAMTDSDKSWGAVELVAKKRYVAHFISQELSEDSLVSITDDAVREMAFALAQAEDAEAINGDGTSAYRGVQGVKNGIGTAGVYTAGSGDDEWDELSIVDFTGTMGKLPEQYQNGSLSWVCSSNFYHSVMLRVQAEAGGNTVMNIQQGDNGRRMFLNYPVYFTNQMPTATAASTKHAYFGNWMEAGILGERTGVRVSRSDDYKFLTDQITLKATARYDLQFHALGTAAAAGAVVALSTNS